ncbi:Potassium uptake protein KtrB [Mucinivorans hirudinis]|uniref:Potassium uptake protein KtrB n=1 Tax=Mucinivorans hirudinis TaxID=1433126 RepID=A0A060RBE6_9BACT|nr:Potassium uptake protein KtrB [Mucinivorans hirudinis]
MKRKFSLTHFIVSMLRFDFERILTFGYISKHPHRQLIFGYLSYIVVGTLLLCLPFMTSTNVGFLDHIFSATSAVSTTGLSTVDVSSAYTFSGKLVILLLIQLGGLGYMTMSCFVMFSLTKHFTIIKKGIIAAEFTMPGGITAKNLVKSVVGFTFFFEVIGALLLYFLFADKGVENPVGTAIFHSVSAFCTAGFSTFSDSLMQFRDDWGVNLVVIVLSYAGAMGFIVMHDLWQKITTRGYKITFTSKVIVLVTLALSALATTQMFFFEPSLLQYPASERFLMSLFQSMSALTTVGFNTINIGGLIPITLLSLTMIMYFGASPSGTGGGLKTTTLTATMAFVKSKLGQNRDVTLFGRTLPTYRIDTALATFVLYTAVICLSSLILTATEDFDYLVILFESASALGTVGLSTGITPELSSEGKLVLIVVMFIGRVGVLTFGFSMLHRMKQRTTQITKQDDLAV